MSGNLQRKIDGVTANFTNAALTATGAETVFDTTVDGVYSINGKLYLYNPDGDGSGGADQTTPTTDGVTAAAFSALTGTATAGEGTVVVWCYTTTDDEVKCCMGTIEDVDASGNFTIPPMFPNIPDTMCPFAYQVLKFYGSASTWTFGTSNWNAVTSNTIVNVAQLPDRPQVS